VRFSLGSAHALAGLLMSGQALRLRSDSLPDTIPCPQNPTGVISSLDGSVGTLKTRANFIIHN
jgi:hypothetical protein